MNKNEIIKKQVNLIDFVKQVNESLNISNVDQKEENPISELMMHKILYLLYGEFYQTYQRELFKNANFVAWKLGPVELDYRTWLQNRQQIQCTKFNLDLSFAEVDFLENLIKKLLRHSPWYLVDVTHYSQPWLNAYKNSKTQNISIETIKSYF